MQSKTSFFNKTVFVKDLTRFFPLWLGYLIYFMFNRALGFIMQSPEDCARSLIDFMIPMMGFMNFIYAPICALVLFSDLYVPKLCNALHALPIRRESWFFTHAAAGLLFSLIPNFIISLTFIPSLGIYMPFALLALLIVSLQFMIFFGISLFCVFSAGNKLGMLGMYGVINFGALLLFGILDSQYIPLIDHIDYSPDFFFHLCPVFLLCGSPYLDMPEYGPHGPYRIEELVVREIYYADFLYLGVALIVALVFAYLALMLYRRRQLESAGDFLAFPFLRHIFLTVITLTMGLFFFASGYLVTMGEIRFIQYLFQIVGMFVGFFAGKMLLEKAVNVFKPKNLLIFASAVIIFMGSLLITKLDPLGISTYIPSTDKIEKCRLTYSHYNFDSKYTDEQQGIEMVRNLHQMLVDSPDSEINSESDTVYSVYPVYITYELKSGRTVSRTYYICTDPVQSPELYKELLRYCSSPHYMFGSTDPEKIKDSVSSIEVMVPGHYQSNFTLPQEVYPGLYAAMQQDCMEGNMLQGDDYHPDDAYAYELEIIFNDGKSYYYHNSDRIYIYSSCVHTRTYLNNLSSNIFHDLP